MESKPLSFVLLSDCHGYQHDSLSQDMPLYGLSDPNESEWIVSEPQIQPVSCLMLEKHVARDICKWDKFGKLKSKKDQVNWLTSNKRYDNTPLISPLFGKREDNTICEPKSISFSEIKRDQEWKHEEDDVLFSLANQFQQNWALVSESINSLHISLYKRSEWDCYHRYSTLNSKSFKSDMDLDFFLIPTKSARVKSLFNTQSEVEKQFISRYHHRFDSIKKVARKRDAQKSSSKFLN